MVRQPIAWPQTGTHVLPHRNVRYRLASVFLGGSGTSTTHAFALLVRDGGGNIAARFDGAAPDGNPALTFAANAPVMTASVGVGVLSFLPPDLWIEPEDSAELVALTDPMTDPECSITVELEDDRRG